MHKKRNLQLIENKKNVFIYEGPTGILNLTWDDGQIECIPPDTNLDNAIELLHSFYFIKTESKVFIKDAFWEGSIDWFPTCISLLYWQYFYTYVKYKPLIDEWMQGKVNFNWKNKGSLYSFIQLQEGVSQNKSTLDKFVEKIGTLVVDIRNNLVCKNHGDFLFQRFSINDFRTAEILDSLRAENFKITQLIPFSKREFLQNFFDSRIIFTSGAKKVPMNFESILISPVHSPVMMGALNYAQRVILGHRGRYASTKKMLANKRFRGYLGIDDANWVYPYIYAAQDIGIAAYGIQHGVYVKKHIAYMMPHINQYRWYDKVLVWGSYWREKILTNSCLYDEKFHVICGNKHIYDYTKIPKEGLYKTILIPYEFLADTTRIGQYINKFIENGFIVYFKVRPDDSIEDQIKSYGDNFDPKKFKVVSQITPELMAEIDIVAGTQTTLLYDLLPFNKPTWILSTSFHLLKDMVEDGLAENFSMDDFDGIEGFYSREMEAYRNISQVEFSGHRSITSALKDLLNGE
ncbi:hypothetical protein G6656_09020 [Polynucleobacter paneuropaeus]|nr:hypothetical protein [Polynucleobacter paneuropaeus]